MSEEELNNYFEALSKEHSYFIQQWFETQAKTELDEYISHLTKEEKDALFILLIMKFMNLFDKKEVKNETKVDERSQGKWIEGGKDVTGQYFYDEFICNKCSVVVDNKSNFCPRCGADMRGEEVCNNCGEVVEKNYCPNCGLRKVKK